MAKQKALQELLDEAIKGNMSESDSKLLSQKLGNLDIAASQVSDERRSLTFGSRWHGTYQIYVDWDGNANYTGTYDDLTNRFVRASIRRGVASPTQFTASPALIEIELSNADRLLSTDNPDSPLVAQLVSTTKKRCKVCCLVNGTSYQLYDGWVKEVAAPSKERNTRNATLIVDDLIGRLAQTPMVSTLVQNPSEVVLLAQALASSVPSHYGKVYYGACYYGYNPSPDDIVPSYDTAIDSFSYGGDLWKESTTSVLDAINDVMRSCLGYFYVDRTGTPTYKNRQDRPTGSLSVDWDASKVALLDAVGVSNEDLYNDIILKINQRKEETVDVVWSLTASITLGAYESQTYSAIFSDPSTGTPCGVLNGIPPVAGVDYVVSGGSASVNVAWRGADAVVTITNTSGSSIAVSSLQLRGTPVTSYQGVQFSSSSGATPKKTKWHTAPVLTNILAADSYADWLLTLFNDVTADSRQATIYPSSPDTLEEMCQVDMNTRLTVSGTQIAHVNWVHHQIGPGYHFLTVGVSPAVITTMWILGTSELGVDTALGV